MGNCTSSASVENHEIKGSYKNLEFAADNLLSHGIPGLASLHSQRGMKGLNQDSAVLCQGFGKEGGFFCGVFDGHGRNGHLVSRLVRDRLPWLVLAQRNLLASLDQATNKNDNKILDSSIMFDQWKEACISGFKVMDKELELHEMLDSSCSGTTAVTIIKQDEDIVIANLGDSRAVLGTISDEGELIAVQLTTDLKPNVPEEAERIKKSHGRVFASTDEPHVWRVWLPNDDSPGLAMARAFGDFLLKKYGVIPIPQVSHHRLTSRDLFIVLATDGVWDVLSNKEVVSIVQSAESEEASARAVVDKAFCAWKQKYPSSMADDCSVVCLFLQDKGSKLVLDQ